MTVAIKPRERDAISQSLRAGVVPRIGLRHLQVGRLDEVAAVLEDLKRVEQGSACIRFIVGKYGAGKSFFLNLARMVAIERRFVVAQADITIERRLHGSAGQAQSLRGVDAEPHDEGRSLRVGPCQASLSDGFRNSIIRIRSSGGTDDRCSSGDPSTSCKPLQSLVSGFDFAIVIGCYVEGFQHTQDDLMGCHCDGSGGIPDKDRGPSGSGCSLHH